MEEGRLISTENNPSVSPANTLETTGAAVPVSNYAPASTVYSLDSLETQAPTPGVVGPQPTSNAAPQNSRPPSYAKKRALMVSAIVTAIVIILTAGLLLVLSKKATPGNSSVNGVPSQTLDVKGENSTATNLGLVSGVQALVVKGDVIARGQLKIANDDFVGSIVLGTVTQNNTYQLPNSSGTFCLSSNNCNFVTSDVLQGAVDSVDIPASVVITNVFGSGGSATISTTVNGISDSVSLQGTTDQVTVNVSGNSILLGTPQNIGISSTPTFGGLTLNGNLQIGQSNTVYTNRITQTSAGNGVEISAGAEGITFYANGLSFILPNFGGAGQTICTTGISCAEGGGEAVILGPNNMGTSASQTNASPTLSSIFINNTGGANLLRLQSSGSDVFVVNSAGLLNGQTIGTAANFTGTLAVAGAVTGGTYNGQTITSAANFTGTLAVATSVHSPIFDRASSGTLAVANANATSLSLCNSAACDLVTIATNTDVDTITIGDTLDTLNLAGQTLSILTSSTGTGSISFGDVGSGYGYSVNSSGNMCLGYLCGAIQTTTTGLGTGTIKLAEAGSYTLTLGNSDDIVNISSTTSTFTSTSTSIQASSSLSLNSSGTATTNIGNTSSGLLTLQGKNTIDNRGNTDSVGYLSTPFGGIGTYQNLLKYSEALNQSANWTTTNLTSVFADYTGATPANMNPAPSGTTSADKIFINNIATTPRTLSQTNTISSCASSCTYTFSIWLKGNTGSESVGLRIDSNGTPATGTVTNVTPSTSEWKRFSVTQSFSTGITQLTAVIVLNESTVNLGAWGAQLIQSAQPGVYTLTNASSVATLGLGVVSNGGSLFTSQADDKVAVTIQPFSSNVAGANLLNVQSVTGVNWLSVSAVGTVSVLGTITSNASASAGNSLTIKPGDAVGSGGDISVDAGSGSTAGAIKIGTNLSANVTIGRSGGSNSVSIYGIGGIQLFNATTVSGTNLTVGTSTVQGQLRLHDGTGAGEYVTIRSLNQAANRAVEIPIITSDDTFCLSTAANCAGLATTTLQQAYGNDADGSDAIISLTSADGSIVISNPASSGSSSEFVLKVQQAATGAKSGLLVTSAGDSSGYALRVNDDGTDTDSTPLIVSNSGDVIIGATTTGLAKLVSAVSSSSTSQYQNVAGALGLVNYDPTDNNWVELFFGDDSTNNAATAISTKITSHTNNYGDLHFSTRSAGGLSSKLVVLSSGNVGIGDTAPAALFTVGSGGLFRVNSSGAITAVTGITSTGDINLGNGVGLVLGNSSNANLEYDGGPDSRLELTGSGATLFIEDRFSLGIDSVTIADNGVGASSASLTLNPNSSYVSITCNDADGCTITMDEASPVKEGNIVYIINYGNNNPVYFTDTAGVTELAGNFTLSQYDSIQMLYATDRWIETARSNN